MRTIEKGAAALCLSEAREKNKNPQCQKKDEHEISAGAYVTLLTFLIEFIYLSTINNL